MFILGLTEMPEEDKEIPLTHHLKLQQYFPIRTRLVTDANLSSIDFFYFLRHKSSPNIIVESDLINPYLHVTTQEYLTGTSLINNSLFLAMPQLSFCACHCAI